MMAPCIERKLAGMGVAGDDVEKAVKAAERAATHADKATALYRALLPLMRGETSETTALGVIVALELTDGDGALIATKEQVAMEAVRMMAPCIERKLAGMGVAGDDVEKAVKAAERAATHADKATALYRALLPLMRGETSETTAMGVIVALELTDGKGEPIATKEQVAMEAVRMMAPCIERKLAGKGAAEAGTAALMQQRQTSFRFVV
jgi:hypothetical protein